MDATQYANDWFGPDNLEYQNCREFSLIDPPDLVTDDADAAPAPTPLHKAGPDVLKQTNEHIKKSIESQFEAVAWLENTMHYDPHDAFWEGGLVVAQRPSKPDYSLFCDSPFLVDKIFESKSSFDGVPKETFQNSRAAVNPYENLGRSCFNYKGAVKMANLDSIFNLLNETQLLPGEQALRVADVCGGPGGFSEYILWRANENRRQQKFKCYQHARSFGITLVTDSPSLNFNPARISQEGQPFFPHQGVEDGTGDITKLANIDAFVEYVLRDGMKENPPCAYVPLVLGDGATIFEGDENNQEYTVTHMLLGQFLTAMSLLREGGVFLCKLYDCFTPFTASLLYFMLRHFKHMSIVKPLTSRPSNSERYVCFRGFRHTNPQAAIAYLRSVCAEMTRLADGKARIMAQRELLESGSREELEALDRKLQDMPEVLSIVPLQLLQGSHFRAYLQDRNTDLACKQLNHLYKISEHIKDPGASTHNWQQDDEIRRRCFDLWDIPLSRDGGKGNFGQGKGNFGKGNFGQSKGNFGQSKSNFGKGNFGKGNFGQAKGKGKGKDEGKGKGKGKGHGWNENGEIAKRTDCRAPQEAPRMPHEIPRMSQEMPRMSPIQPMKSPTPPVNAGSGLTLANLEKHNILTEMNQKAPVGNKAAYMPNPAEKNAHASLASKNDLVAAARSRVAGATFVTSWKSQCQSKSGNPSGTEGNQNKAAASPAPGLPTVQTPSGASKGTTTSLGLTSIRNAASPASPSSPFQSSTLFPPRAGLESHKTTSNVPDAKAPKRQKLNLDNVDLGTL